MDVEDLLAVAKAAGTPPLQIIHRNETLQMLDQPIFVLKRPRSRLAGEYRSLTRTLQIENPGDRDGALLFLREVQKRQSKLLDSSGYYLGKWGERISPLVAKRLHQITDHFWSDADVLVRVGQLFSRYKESDMALKRFNRVLELRQDFGEALFARAFCYRGLRDDAAAVEDLLNYLRNHDIRPEKNEAAIMELLSISLDVFLKTLDLPPVPINIYSYRANSRCEVNSHNGLWLLSGISMGSSRSGVGTMPSVVWNIRRSRR